MNYVAPWWLPGGNLQTIWPALRGTACVRPAGAVTGASAGARRMVTSSMSTGVGRPVDCRSASLQATLLVMFHGLEGSSASHYAQAFADFARNACGALYAVAHFRGCSGELNHGPRAYHSGDFEEIDWILGAHSVDLHAGRLWPWVSPWAATH
jgi:predicted alpha/beta-fold hydrolase